MDLNEVRAQIDRIDPRLRELLMERLNCSYQVARAKAEAGETQIYRADREADILKKLSQGVSPERLAGYRSVVRKIMETSRMYQYHLLYDWNEQVFDPLVEGLKIPSRSSTVTVRVTREDHPNAMASILSMIGDYGFNMERMELISEDKDRRTVTFDLVIRGDLNEREMKTLMFQLSGECLYFKILGAEK